MLLRSSCLHGKVRGLHPATQGETSTLWGLSLGLGLVTAPLTTGLAARPACRVHSLPGLQCGAGGQGSKQPQAAAGEASRQLWAMREANISLSHCFRLWAETCQQGACLPSMWC